MIEIIFAVILFSVVAFIVYRFVKSAREFGGLNKDYSVQIVGSCIWIGNFNLQSLRERL